MKFSVVFSVIICTLIFTESRATGQDPYGTERSFSLTVTSEAWSKYVYYGSLVSEEPVLQTDIYWEHKTGWYAGVWHSVGLDGSGLSSDSADELDYYVGWTGLIPHTPLLIDAGVIYYDLADLGKFRDDFLAIYGEVSREFEADQHLFTPFIRAEQQFPVSPSETIEGGALLDLGLRHEWQFSDPLAMSQEVKMFYDSGIAGLDSGFFAEYRASIVWQTNERLSITPIQFRVSAPINSVSDGRGTEFVWGCGITVQF